MLRIISYSSFFCKSTRENQDITFIHIREITMREKTEQYEFNHTLQETNYKNTISQYEFSSKPGSLTEQSDTLL